VLLPTESDLTGQRSPFVDKESMEHFEMRDAQAPDRHPRPGPKTIDALMRSTCLGRGHRDQA
jgi:ribosomal protein S10